MAVFINIVATGSASIRRRDMNSYLREGMRTIAESWHKRRRPRHFKRSAFNEYGYAKRSTKYEQHKRRAQGHTDPLVFTGISRSRSETKNVRATSKASTVSMPVQGFNRKARGQKADMSRELRTVTNQEATDLENKAGRLVERRIQSHSGRKTRKVRS